MKKVLFVCLGNICRSPTAEAVFRHLLKQAEGVQNWVVDSAGTHAYHVGKAPDKRSRQAAEQRGYAMLNMKARQVSPQDFYDFDWILAMDHQNLSELVAMVPDDAPAKLELMLSYASAQEWRGSDVPDPYYGGEHGFEDVLNRLEDGCREFLQRSSF